MGGLSQEEEERDQEDEIGVTIMALTRDFKETIRARAAKDAAFRRALLSEAIDSMLEGDVETGKIVLRDYINATIGFDKLGEATQRNPKSLMRMLSASGNPQANNLFEVVAHLQESEGFRLSTRASISSRSSAKAPAWTVKQPLPSGRRLPALAGAVAKRR